MRKIVIWSVVALMALAIAAVPALAARQTPTGNAKFQSGPNCTENAAGDVRCTGLITGLGSDDVTASLTTFGTATVQCTNPGGQIVEAQADTAPANTTVSGLRPENGRLAFDITAFAPTTLASNPCPNGRWTATILDVNITAYQLTFSQLGQVVLDTGRVAI
jgi:hypothetical protein